MIMNKKHASRCQLGRYLLTLPIIAVFVVFFTMSRAANLPKADEHVAVSAPTAYPVHTADTEVPQNETTDDRTKVKRRAAKPAAQDTRGELVVRENLLSVGDGQRQEGVVVAADGTPIAGATVRSQATGRTTTTNEQGEFVLDVAAGDTLLISY